MKAIAKPNQLPIRARAAAVTTLKKIARKLSSSNRIRESLLPAAVLLLITAVVTRGITKGEFNFNTDETINAVTGLYVADFLRDLPLAHPVQYTYRYYAQYPALGLFHWPPFFHFIEGIGFLILRPSPASARLAVLAFVLLGLYFWFKLVSELQNQWTAAVSTILLAFLPSLLLFEKTVMLEVPSLALCIAASYFWVRYLRVENRRDLYWSMLFASASLLTRYQSVYLMLFCLLTLAVARKWRLVLNRTSLAAFGMFVLLTGPYYVLAFIVHGRVLSKLSFSGPGTGLNLNQQVNPYAYYWLALPKQLGWPLIALAALGMATYTWWGKRETARVLVVWIVACYLVLSFLAAREFRYITHWLPAWVFFIAGFMTAKLPRKWMRVPQAAIVVGILGTYTWSAWNYARPYVFGFEEVARRATQSNSSDMILYDGGLPGNFIFYVRCNDPARRFFVLRKALYVTRNWGGRSVQLVHTQAEVENLIDRYGIQNVVVVENSPILFDAQKALLSLLRTPRFKLIERFPVETNLPELKSLTLLLYQNLRVVPRSAHKLSLRMLTLDHDIVVSLDKPLGQ